MAKFLSYAMTLVFASALVTGCMTTLFRPQSPEADEDYAAISESDVQLVGDISRAYGMGFMKVENVALVTGLSGTGEDPPPSPQRAALLGEMNYRKVEDPNEVLASPNTALVLLRSFLRPGIQAGERFDVEVRTPTRSDVKSLRGGTLLATPLTETAVLGNQIRKGHIMAYAEGPILVDPSAEIDEPLATHGRILGGGVAAKPRTLGLLLDDQHQSVAYSLAVSKAVSKRFYTYHEGVNRGVAEGKDDKFIEILPHPRYKENFGRYIRVIGSVALRETPYQRQSRLKLLEAQLADPVTSSTAALRLEAIGNDEAVEILKGGAKSSDPEVRFYAAEALAYLDDTSAVAPLATIAVEEPAFRINALAALSAMEDGAAHESLKKMLSEKSAETRYGAFRGLWTMNPNDPLIRGEDIDGEFRLHLLDVQGPPMVHVTSSHRAEIVLFGAGHALQLPLLLDAGHRIMVKGNAGGEITVSRFAPGEPTQKRVVSTKLEDVIRAIVELGGKYPDIVQMLQQAKEAGALPSRFRVNALPETGREFQRERDLLEETTARRNLSPGSAARAA